MGGLPDPGQPLGAGAVPRDSLSRSALGLLAALGLAGCGGQLLDTAKIEREIAKAIEARTELDVTEVECPEEVEAKEGDRFECKARGPEGGEARVTVTQTDAEGNVEFQAPDLRGLR